jgi:hypothetical protein
MDQIQRELLKIEDKIEDVSEKVVELTVIASQQTVILERQEKLLERNTDSLEEHMKRTHLLEKEVLVINTERASTFRALKIIAGVIGFIGIGGLVVIVKALLGI